MEVQLASQGIELDHRAASYVRRLVGRLFQSYGDTVQSVGLFFTPRLQEAPDAGVHCMLRLQLHGGAMLVAEGASRFVHSAAECAVEQGWTLLLADLRRRPAMDTAVGA